MGKFKVTLCCPIPRKGFAEGKAKAYSENELTIMEDYVSKADGDIVVFPEGFVRTSYVDRAVEIAKKYHKFIVVGSQDEGEHKSLYTLFIDENDGVIYSHRKASLTPGDRACGALQGEEIGSVDTKFGKFGPVLCYEMHFPEVSRIVCLEGAKVIFNTIGTGMWHEQQLDDWTSIARVRAIENRVYVLGCTHYADTIPLMFAYDPSGKCLLLERDYNGCKTVEVDLDAKFEENFFCDRYPKAYKKLCE